jgi:hypothetical protein
MTIRARQNDISDARNTHREKRIEAARNARMRAPFEARMNAFLETREPMSRIAF